MSDEEQLVELIRSCENPTEAIMIAVQVIIGFLNGQQLPTEESSALPSTA